MNRFPWWKNFLVAFVVVLGCLYTMPNFFGEAPAVQISSARPTLKIEASMANEIEVVLKQANLRHDGLIYEDTLGGGTLKIRFQDTDTQLKARDVIQSALRAKQAAGLDAAGDSYVVALNLLSRSPDYLTRMRALPMYLGLDLRGGVHFLLQVDMKSATTKRLDSLLADLRTAMRENNYRYQSIQRSGETIQLQLREDSPRDKMLTLIKNRFPELLPAVSAESAAEGKTNQSTLILQWTDAAEKTLREYALKQNITTLHNRINELGVAEPIIAQQGADRIVVQLPGVQDTAKAKDILGRTATLEIRMVDESPEAQAAALSGGVLPGTDRFVERGRSVLLLKKQVILTGENLTDAQAGFDQQTNEPVVNLTLDSKGARVFREVTRENVGRRMAILLVERGRGEVVTAPVIRSEIAGGRVQISGSMNTREASDVALLLRAGSLAAPMDIIEERTIGPSLGADNIAKGFRSTWIGFTAIAVFMIAYYMLFGLFSVLALAANVLLLIAALSVLQATLTLPGIAAIALTLGMAIDANVLINERIREELRDGASPQAAIAAGYDRAWATILDSNITTLIAGLALLIFGSGAVRGFAVVHCLGILTSIFSAVLVSRALVNAWYGRRKRLTALSIGQVWKSPEKVV